MADNDDQSRSDNIFYMRLLHERACKALCIDPDRNSWFDIVDGLEVLAAKGDMTHDKAYRDGLKRGFDLGESGRAADYQKEFLSYHSNILRASLEEKVK